MSIQRLRAAITVIALGILAGSVSAQPSIGFAFTPDGAPTSFNVVQGQTVTVPVYVVERRLTPGVANPAAAGGDILRIEGLLAAGVRLNFSTSAGSSTATAAAANPAFNLPTSGFPVFDNAAGFASVSAGTTNGAGVAATGDANAVGVLVGSFTFLGNTVGNVTTLTTAKPQSASFPEIVSNATFTVLENQTYAPLFSAPVSTTVTVIPVPEPASLIAFLAAAGFASRIRRRHTPAR